MHREDPAIRRVRHEREKERERTCCHMCGNKLDSIVYLHRRRWFHRECLEWLRSIEPTSEFA